MMTSTSRPNGRKMPAGWIWQTSHLQNFSQRRRKRHLRTKANSSRFLLGRECVILRSLYALAAAQAGLKQTWILNITGERAEWVKYIEELCSFLQRMTACFEKQPNSFFFFLHVCSVTLPHTSDPHFGSLCQRTASSEFFLGAILKSHYWPRVRGIKMEKHTAGVRPQLTARHFWLKKKKKSPTARVPWNSPITILCFDGVLNTLEILPCGNWVSASGQTDRGVV